MDVIAGESPMKYNNALPYMLYYFENWLNVYGLFCMQSIGKIRITFTSSRSHQNS